MKIKSYFLYFLLIILVFALLSSGLKKNSNEIETLKNINLDLQDDIKLLENQVTKLNEENKKIDNNLEEIKKEKDKQQEEQKIGEILFYIVKLKDRDFTSTYGEGYTWYIAAEELGLIGKPAIPYLIKNLDTKDDYVRALTLYALLLATQDDDVKEFTNGEYIKTYLDFDSKSHPEKVEIAKAWWEKYKHNWE